MRASPASKAPALSRRGFTIVELMVSIAILSLLVLMLAGVFNLISSAWRTGEGNIERRRGARALTDYIGAELRSAMLPVEGKVVPGKGNLQFLINPPTSQVPDAYRNADCIFWQAPLATETSFGDIAEIGYFVRWIDPDAKAKLKGITAPRPALCRFFVNPSISQPSATTGALVPMPNDDFLIYHPTPTAWLSQSLLDRLAPAKAPTFAGLFGENVLGLWVQAYGLEGQKLPRSFYSLPKSAGDPNAGYNYFRPYPDTSGATGKKQEWFYLPARVRVSIVQIDSHHVQRLDPVHLQVRALARESTVEDAAGFLNRVRDLPELRALLPGLRTYTTEIQLENGR